MKSYRGQYILSTNHDHPIGCNEKKKRGVRNMCTTKFIDICIKPQPKKKKRVVRTEKHAYYQNDRNMYKPRDGGS